MPDSGCFRTRIWQTVFKNFVCVLLLSVALLSGCQSTPEVRSEPDYLDELHGAVFDPPRVLSDFSLMSTTGEPFRLSEHRGEALLVYFGYRACPDFCPTTFAELLRVYKALGEPSDRLRVLFVTVDPERDTLENLRLYIESFHQDFIALRDDGEALKQLMAEFGVTAQRRQLGESALSYLIDHTASVFLIGPDGRLQAQYLYGTDYRDIVHDLELILETV